VNDIRHLFDLFLPVNHLWWAIFGQSFTLALKFLYNGMAAVPPLQFLGAYGLAIILLTVVIKVVLSPLYHFQLSVSRKTQAEQRRIAPEVAAVRKKFKNEPQKQQAALMELYKEHGINPLSSLTGCLPAVVQLPILTALYYVFLGNARTHAFVSDHFLWVPHLNDYPNAHPLFTGLPIPAVAYLVIPLLAAATTFVQSRMMQQPPNPNATEQEQQAQQMTQSMQVVMPLMIAYFAFVTPAGLGLYWFISNCFAIIQQYFVNGWGGMRRGGPPPLQATPPSVKPKPKDPGPAPKAPPGARPRRARR
jgi:YidC/Oxa1 family membrane protein insertase